MKNLCAILLFSLFLLSFSSVSAENLHSKLIIVAIPSSKGDAVVEGQLKYEKNAQGDCI